MKSRPRYDLNKQKKNPAHEPLLSKNSAKYREDMTALFFGFKQGNVKIPQSTEIKETPVTHHTLASSPESMC